jgi:hypothetical protein
MYFIIKIFKNYKLYFEKKINSCGFISDLMLNKKVAERFCITTTGTKKNH